MSDELFKVALQLEARRAIVREIETFSEEFLRDNARFDHLQRPVWDESLVQTVGTIGLMTLVYLAKAGDRESARWLAEKSLGAPEQSFKVQISEWDSDSVDGEMFAMLKEIGKSEVEARRILAAVAAGDLRPLVAALPAEGETVDAEFTESE